MATGSQYEEKLLEELKDLSEVEQAKLLKLIRFLKEKILQERTDSATKDKAAILRHAGLLTDLSPEEEGRFAQAVRRRSLFGDRPVRL